MIPARLREPNADPFAVLDATGRILAVNDAVLARTGRPVGDLVGRALDEHWVLDPELGQPGELPDVLDRVRREAIVRVDARLGADGTGPHQALVLFVTSDDPAVAGGTFGLSLSDPGPRRWSESLELPIDQLTVGVVVYGLDGAVLHLNQAMYRLFGRTPEDMPASDMLLVHPHDRAAAVTLGLRAYCGEIDGWTRTKRLVRPDGELVWVEETVSLVRGDDGLPRYFIAQNSDVSETRRNEAALAESEAQVRFLADGLPVALVEIDVGGVIADGNAAAREMFGEAVIGQSIASVTHPDDFKRVHHAITSPERAGNDSQIDFRVRRRDGEWRWVRAHARLHVDRGGRFTKAVATIADITDEVLARESSQQLCELLEAVDDIVVIADTDGRVTYLNAMGRSLLGDADAGVGRPLTDLFTRDSAAEIRDVALPTVKHFGSWTGEARILPPGMEPRVVLLSLVAHTDERSGETSISAMTRDITELKRAEEAMRRAATSDPLTGLPNRAILFDRLTHALARTGRNGGGLALLFVDLDHFKHVNDQMGHDAGDELLVQVSRRLLDSVRDCDTVARIGGDEFVVLAEPVIRNEDAMVVANRIVDALSRPFSLTAGEARIGASVGMATSRRESTSRSLLKQADTAVYRAKAEGRSRVVAFDR